MIKNSNKISVLMSVYNSEKTITNSINSILNQSYTNFELLIVNDASTDSTIEICKNFENLDNRIQIYNNKKNIGLTKSLNYLIPFTTGDYIARQDADDLSLSSRFEKQIEIFSNTKADSCNTRAIIKESNIVTPSVSYYLPFIISMKFKNPFVHGSLMIKASVLKELNGYDENFYYAQDYKLMNDLLLRNYQPYIIKEPLYVLNQKDNISTNHKKEQDYFAHCVRKNQQPSMNL